MAMSTRDWVDFFEKAGIPSNEAGTYALIFTQNRIQKNMLPDLNKEYLKDMGISLLGDVIAILKHAKHVHERNVRVGLLDPSPDQSTEVQNASSPAEGTTVKKLMDYCNQKYKEAEECLKVVMKSMPENKNPKISLNETKAAGKVIIKKEPRSDLENEPVLRPHSKVTKNIPRLEAANSTTTETVVPKKSYSVFSRLGDIPPMPLSDPEAAILESKKEPIVIRKNSMVADSLKSKKSEPVKSNTRGKEKDFLKANSLTLLKITTHFSDDDDVEDTTPKMKKSNSISRPVESARIKKRPITFNSEEDDHKESTSKKVRFGATSTKVIDDSKKPMTQPVFINHTIVPRGTRNSFDAIRPKTVQSVSMRQEVGKHRPSKPLSKMVADSIPIKKPSSVRARIGRKGNALPDRKKNVLDRIG